MTKIEENQGGHLLQFAQGDSLVADVVIMATGIRTNLEWLQGSGIETADGGQGGILVDDHLRTSVRNVYAAGDVARGRNLVSGAAEVHAILNDTPAVMAALEKAAQRKEPTASYVLAHPLFRYLESDARFGKLKETLVAQQGEIRTALAQVK